MCTLFRARGNESRPGLQLVKSWPRPWRSPLHNGHFLVSPVWLYWRGSTIYIYFSFSCRKFCSAFHLNQWLAGRHFHKGIFIVSKINNTINVSIYDYRKQSTWFFSPLKCIVIHFWEFYVICNTLCFSDYSIKVFYGSGECLVLNIPTSDSDDIPEIVRRLEEISIGCQVKLFFCVSSLYIGKHCPVKSNYSLPA